MIARDDIPILPTKKKPIALVAPILITGARMIAVSVVDVQFDFTVGDKTAIIGGDRATSAMISDTMYHI